MMTYVLTNYSDLQSTVTYFGAHKLNLRSLLEKIYQIFRGRVYFFEFVHGKVKRLQNQSLPRGFNILYLRGDDSAGAKCSCKFGCIRHFPIPIEIQSVIKTFLVPVTE